MKNWNTPEVLELDIKATATTYCAPGGNRPPEKPSRPGGGNVETYCVTGKDSAGS